MNSTQTTPQIDDTQAAPSGRVCAFDLLADQPWAMLPGALETMISIARRENESPEAVEAKLGRPLQNTRVVTVRNGVALVPITGPIFRYANLFSMISGATSMGELATDFTAAVEDPQVKGVVLVFDSPGGQAYGIAEFAQMIRSADKPVVAYVDGAAASAAYWLAAAADEVVVSKTGEVGSIGAVYGIDTSKRGEVVEIVSSQSPKKRPDVTTSEGRTQMQERIDKFAQVFIDDVAAYRGVSVEKVLSDFGQGDMRLGEEAVQLGMADRVSTLEEVIAGLAGTAAHKAAGKPANPQSNPKGSNAMNKEELRAAHPELCAALVEEGRQAGLQAGAEQERNRIKAVEGKSMPGHEALIATLKYDGKTTGAEAAEQVLAAEQAVLNGKVSAFAADTPNPVSNAQPSDDKPAAEDKSLPVEERAKATWDKDANVRAEFRSLGAYTAYLKHSEAGNARVLGQK